MRKKVAIVTAFAGYANVQRQQLQKLFKDHIEVKCFSLEVDTINQPIDASLFVITLHSLHHAIKDYIPKDAKVIILSSTITNAQYEQIVKIPAGTTVMVVNYSVEMTMETLALFHHIGIDHLNFVPFYPGIKNIPKLDIAVTPGEAQYVPHFVKQIVDIGHRVLDADTITEIAMKLNLEHLLNEPSFLEHFQSIKMNKNSLTSLFDKTNILESRLLGLLNVMDDGIVVIDNNGLIHAYNKKAVTILGEKNSIVGAKIADVIPRISLAKVLKTSTETEYNLIKINGHDISVKVVPVIAAGRTSGALAIISRFDEKEKSQQKLRSQLLGKGHRAKYTFEHIISQDPAFVHMKLLTEKKAKSEASILITGESGTGKELFAQAIHNASKRKDGPFVAVNCAALPENLLESELFGYEEGAFTGARKGGKIGLFELAHRGTLFLDEIGEINLNLQARLLRILEEREVMRLGGDSVIHVDIRIVAATNKDLWHLVEEGNFRKDLYYRLNVLPLELPPLRERRADIPLLFEHIKQSIAAKFTITEEVEKIFSNYPWYGNIRELKNCVEYLAYLDKDSIDVKDIAVIIKKQIAPLPPETAALPDFSQAIRLEEENYAFVLECLYDNYKNKLRTGRRSILKLAEDKDIFLTEAQIRKILTTLEAHGLAKLSNGRGGTTITTLGIKAFKSLAAHTDESRGKSAY